MAALSTRTSGRHRLEVRPGGVGGQAGVVAKTSAVMAVSGGLVASLGMQAHAATPPAVEMTTGVGSTVQEASPVPLALVNGVAAAPTFGDIGFTAKATPQAAPAPRARASRAAQPSRSTERVSRSSARTAIAPVSIKAGEPGSSQFGAAVVSIAARYVGVPYRYGGTTPAGFDCSGFTQYVFRQVGISLPRTSSAQRAATTRISRSEAVPGDLVFMPGHVGIYAGNGMMWDAPRTGKSVQLRSVYSSSATYGRVN